MVIMKKEELQELKLNELKQLAKEKELKVTGLKKEELIELLSDKEEVKEEIEDAKEENSEIRISVFFFREKIIYSPILPQPLMLTHTNHM